MLLGMFLKLSLYAVEVMLELMLDEFEEDDNETLPY